MFIFLFFFRKELKRQYPEYNHFDTEEPSSYFTLLLSFSAIVFLQNPAYWIWLPERQSFEKKQGVFDKLCIVWGNIQRLYNQSERVA